MIALVIAFSLLVPFSLVLILLWLRRQRYPLQARGKHLDALANMLGLKREKRERDAKLRARCRDVMRFPPRG